MPAEQRCSDRIFRWANEDGAHGMPTPAELEAQGWVRSWQHPWWLKSWMMELKPPPEHPRAAQRDLPVSVNAGPGPNGEPEPPE